MTPDSLKQEIDNLVQFVSDAKAKVANNEVIDMGDLDKKVQSLCNDIEEHAGESAPEIKEHMNGLITALEDLANDLKNAESSDTE